MGHRLQPSAGVREPVLADLTWLWAAVGPIGSQALKAVVGDPQSHPKVQVLTSPSFKCTEWGREGPGHLLRIAQWDSRAER